MSYTDYSIRSFQGGYDKNLTYLVTCMRTANQFLIDAAVPLAEVSSFINSINGHFALVVQRNDLSFIAVDKIRSIPLFFTKIKNDFYIDFNPKNLVQTEKFPKTIDENAKLELAMSGFTIGNKTIYKNLNSLIAGELVLFSDNQYEYKHYYKYFGKLEFKKYSKDKFTVFCFR